VCSLVEQQRFLQVARSGDFVGMAIWSRRVALMAAFDSLALDIMPGVCAFRVCVKYSPLSHDSFLVAAAVRMHMRSSKSSAGPQNFRQGLSALAPGVDWLRPARQTSLLFIVFIISPTISHILHFAFSFDQSSLRYLSYLRMIQVHPNLHQVLLSLSCAYHV
jgi:hypothetical protein